MVRIILLLALPALPLAAVPAPAGAQVAATSCCNTSQPALRVFLDCNRCDGDYLRDHVAYTVGASHYDYSELTIFNKLAETVPEHSVNVVLGLRQPWGSLNTSLNFTQQLNMPERCRLSTGLETNVRLFKGFSFDVYARFDRIRNLISLRQEPATDTEVLLRLQQQATGYSYYAGFGVSYSFGSIFNSIVNPRFGGS